MNTITRAALFAVLLCLPGPSRAEGDKKGPGDPEKTGPCNADIEKFCKDVTPGAGRIMHCLWAYEDKLSPDCKAQGKPGKGAMMADAMKSCEADKEKFCKSVEPGGGRIAECIKAHESELTPACADTLKRKHHGGKPRGGQDGKEKKQ